MAGGYGLLDPSNLDVYRRLGAAIPVAGAELPPVDRSPFRSGLESAYGALRYGLPEAVESAVGTLTPERAASYQAGLRQTQAQAEKLLPGGPVTDFSSAGGVYKTFKENLLTSLPQMGATLAGGVAGSVLGGPVGGVAGGLAVASPFFVGTNVQRATDNGNQGLTHDAAMRSIAVAPVQGALDVASELLLPGAGAIFGKFAPKFGRAGASMLTRVVEHGLAAAGAEGVTEAAQQTGERYAAGKPVTGSEATQEYVQAGAVGALLGGVLGSFGGIRGKHPADVSNENLEATVDQATTPTLALPSPVAYTDAAGRTVVGSGGDETLRATPIPSVSEPVAAIPQAQSALPSPAMAPNPAAPTLDETGTPSAVPVDPAVAQVLEGMDNEQLDRLYGHLSQKLATGGATQQDAAMREAMKAEIVRRTPVPPVEVPTAPLALPAPQITLDEQGNPSARAVPLDEQVPSFADRFAEMKQGLSSQFVKKLAPKDEGDLISKVHDQILAEEEKGGLRANTKTLAQRVGLLDEQEAPTPLFAQITEAKQASPTEETGLPGVARTEGVLPPPEAVVEAPSAGQSGGLTAATRLEGTLSPRGEISPSIVNLAENSTPVPDSNIALNQGEGVAPLSREQVEPEGTPLTDAQRVQASLNNAIDQNFDTNTQPGVVSALKAMITRGDAPEQVQAAIEQAKATGTVPQPAITAALGSNMPTRTITPKIEREVASYNAGTKTYDQLSKPAKNVVDGIMERNDGAGQSGMSVRQAQQVLDQSTGAWRSKTGVKIYARAADIPPDLRSRLSSDQVQGFYDPATDTMHVVAGNHASPSDVKATVFHEMLGHAGLRAAYDQTLTDTLGNIYRTNKDMRTAADQYLANTGKWADLPENIRQSNAVEEVLAHASEQGQLHASVMEKVIHAIRNIGRKMGLDLKYNASDVRAILAWAHTAAVGGTAPASGGVMERTPEGFQKQATDVVGYAKEALRTVGSQEAQSRVRKLVLGFSSMLHIERTYNKVLKGISTLVRSNEDRAAIAARLSQASVTAQDNFFALQKKNPKAAETINHFMQLAGEMNIDVRLPWAKQTWLHSEPGAAALKALADKANEQWNGLKKQGLHTTFDEMAAVNQSLDAMRVALSTRNLVLDPSIDPKNRVAGFDKDPMAEYRAKDVLHNTPTAGRDYWQGVLQQQAKAIKDHIAALPNMAAKRTPQIKELETQLRDIDAALDPNKAPYFHLGRFGNHFVAMRVRVKDGAADPAATDKIAEALQKAGFIGAQITRDNRNPQIYLRVSTLDQRIALHNLAKEFGKQGLLAPDDEGNPRISQGERGNEQLAGVMGHADLLDRITNSIRASEAFEPTPGMSKAEQDTLERAKANAISSIRTQLLDLLPDTSLVKSLTHRKAIMGYNGDMVQNFADRSSVAAQALAALATANQTSDAFVQMRKHIAESKRGDDPVKTDKQQALFIELSRRQAERPYLSGDDPWDTLRAINHTFYLGFSPSYAAVQLTQIPVLLWPELAKKHGFVKSATAIGKVTATAFKVMAATAKVGAEGGLRHAADATITEKALRQAGLDDKTIEFLSNIVNSGDVDIGNAARELGRTAAGKASSNTDTALRYASAMGYYSETLTRVIAALAARELHGDREGVHDYARQTIKEAMFQYSNWNVARQLGKMGFAGKLTPVITAFQRYNAFLTEKLYTETYNLFKGDTKAQQLEAARFLTGHLGGVMLVAGTLGWPMAAVFARAAEKLKDLFDDDEQPADFNAAWRQMLADSFGKSAGEMIARGVVPRALGVDLSQRAGEQALLPFSSLLADRRKWSDAYKDWAAGATGAPANMLMNIVAGSGDILDGNFIDGLTKMAPLALKGPAKAYTMSEKGYIDAGGNKLPMTPGAQDILAQTLGFAPADKAEYNEKRDTLRNRDISLGTEAKQIRKDLAVAIENGDMDTARTMLVKAQKFDSANPGYAVLPGMEGTLQRRAQARAISGATGLPLGVKRRDIPQAQQMVAY